MTVFKSDIEEGNCPLLNLPCSVSEERAEECCKHVFGGFNPVAKEDDLRILECATKRAKRMHEGAIKFYY